MLKTTGVKITRCACVQIEYHSFAVFGFNLKMQPVLLLDVVVMAGH